MTDFLLSPGITPAIVDLAVIALPLAISVGYALRGRAGFEGSVGLVTLALGVVKLYTDWSDAWDDVVSLGGILIGLSVVGVALRRTEISWIPGPVWRGFGAFAIAIGLYKVWSDFYDPFDIELGALLAGAGVWVLVARGSFDRFRQSRSTPA